MRRSSPETVLARILQVLGAATTSVTVGSGCDSFRAKSDDPSGNGVMIEPAPQVAPQPAPTPTVDSRFMIDTSPGPTGDPAPGLYADLCPGVTAYNWEEVCVGPLSGSSMCAEPDSELLRQYGCGLTTGADVACGPVFIPDRDDTLRDALDAGSAADAGDGGDGGPASDAGDAAVTDVEVNDPLASSSLVGTCCYALGGGCAVGRPFIVAGRVRTAATLERTDWGAELRPNVDELDAETRAALADYHAREGIAEHASVASFSRFVLQAVALGAPAELVGAAARAGLDEVEHARSSFGLASAYAGAPLGPGALDVSGALDPLASAETVAVSVAREGCIAETVSALLIAAARDAARDPTVKDVLARVAEEELEHALLAWRFLRWVLERHGECIDAVALVFARPAEWVGFGSFTDKPGSEDLMRAHGYLSRTERRQIAERALRDVVGPAAGALMERVYGKAQGGTRARFLRGRSAPRT